MVNLQDGTIIQGSSSEKIKEWVVWFMTPIGVTPDINQAMKACEVGDFDPRLTIVPVPVARSETLYEVVR